MDERSQVRDDSLYAACRRAIRSSIGGWVENSLPTPDVMPKAWMLLGNSPGTMPPRRASALIMGCLRPSRLAEPASARNSRWRENQATMMAATKPSRMSSTMVVTQ